MVVHRTKGVELEEGEEGGDPAEYGVAQPELHGRPGNANRYSDPSAHAFTFTFRIEASVDRRDP